MDTLYYTPLYFSSNVLCSFVEMVPLCLELQLQCVTRPAAPTCMKSHVFVLCIHVFTTWVDMNMTRERISYSYSCVSLPFFSWESDSEWRTHTHKTTHTHTHTHTSNPNSLQSHSGTDDVIHLWCRRATKALLCLCKYTHTHSLFFLCAGHVSRLNWMHMWLLSAGGNAAFIIRLPSHSSNLENSKSCCVVTKSPLTL